MYRQYNGFADTLNLFDEVQIKKPFTKNDFIFLKKRNFDIR